LDTGCGFSGKMTLIIANAEIQKAVVEQGERQMDNDGENPS
jgi:hypothetical protein